MAASRRQSKKTEVPFTKWSILAFLGALVLLASCRTRNWKHAYETKYFGAATNIPWLTAGITSTAMEHHFAYLHFSDPTNIVLKGDASWNPIHKVEQFIEPIKVASRTLFDVGPSVVVDESGIGYKGRGINWVQFNPMKPNSELQPALCFPTLSLHPHPICYINTFAFC